MDWIAVQDYKELPEGAWLVQLEESVMGSDLAVAFSHPKMTSIGYISAEDAPRVIGYAPLPVPEYEKVPTLEEKQERERRWREDMDKQMAQFLDWYNDHKSEFKYALVAHPTEEYAFTIEGVNPLLQVHYGLELTVRMNDEKYHTAYEEFMFAGATVTQTEHGYTNDCIIKKWRTVYFSERYLMECEVFEVLLDWINNRLPNYNWICIDYDKDSQEWEYCRLRQDKDPYATVNIPLWVNKLGETE